MRLVIFGETSPERLAGQEPGRFSSEILLADVNQFFSDFSTGGRSN